MTIRTFGPNCTVRGTSGKSSLIIIFCLPRGCQMQIDPPPLFLRVLINIRLKKNNASHKVTLWVFDTYRSIRPELLVRLWRTGWGWFRSRGPLVTVSQGAIVSSAWGMKCKRLLVKKWNFVLLLLCFVIQPRHWLWVSSFFFFSLTWQLEDSDSCSEMLPTFNRCRFQSVLIFLLWIKRWEVRGQEEADPSCSEQPWKKTRKY